MNHYDEEFSPEQVEEQIQHYQSVAKHTSANAQLLHDLQHVADEDKQRLKDIRVRLMNHVATTQQQPLPFMRPQQSADRPTIAHTHARGTNKRSRYLRTILSGLVAILIIGSMFGVINLLKIRDKQAHVQPTPIVATPGSIPDIHGLAAYVIDGHTGTSLVSVNQYTHLPVGGLAKIMTAVVTIENINIDQTVTVDQNVLNEVPAGMTTAGLHTGDQLSFRSLLSALLLGSGNDAAAVIAHAVAGNTQNFVFLMNEEAHQLNLNDTHFSDLYGSSGDNNYSSAADMARLASYALQLSHFSQTVAEQQYLLSATFDHHAYTWVNTNPLLTTYAGMNGVEMSYDKNAGACMVFSAERNGRMVIGVELHAPSQSVLISDVKYLLNHSFAR